MTKIRNRTAQCPERHFARHIAANRYPGRGLVIGRSADGDHWLQIYWIMGRSAHSRNRRFTIEGPVLRTEPVDPSKLDAPELIIYSPMLELPGKYIVTNGDQSQTLYESLRNGGSFDTALATREREPDAPHYTPRISGMLELSRSPAITLSILKANPFDPGRTDRNTYRPALPPSGRGLCLTTYAGDGDPLPSFSGEPLVMPLEGGPEEVLRTYWNALDRENRISIALKRVDPDGSSEIMVINRYQPDRN